MKGLKEVNGVKLVISRADSEAGARDVYYFIGDLAGEVVARGGTCITLYRNDQGVYYRLSVGSLVQITLSDVVPYLQ